MYDKLYFNAVRLGMIAGQVDQLEPVIRSADLVSFDMGAKRHSDAPGNAHATVNGLFGDEACQLSRSAGMGDQLTSIGLYDNNPVTESRGRTDTHLSQMIW